MTEPECRHVAMTSADRYSARSAIRDHNGALGAAAALLSKGGAR